MWNEASLLKPPRHVLWLAALHDFYMIRVRADHVKILQKWGKAKKLFDGKHVHPRRNCRTSQVQAFFHLSLNSLSQLRMVSID